MQTSPFLGWLFRMPLIRRWSLMFCVRQENVAEHSHQVAVVAHLLAMIEKVYFKGELNPDRAATLALYHECSETRLGDIVSPVKYSNTTLTREFKALEQAAEQQCIASLPLELQNEFAPLLVQSQVDPEYAKLIKAADVICAYLKAKQELAHHNHEFEHVITNLTPMIDQLKQRPAVRYFMDTFQSPCGATLDTLVKQ